PGPTFRILRDDPLVPVAYRQGCGVWVPGSRVARPGTCGPSSTLILRRAEGPSRRMAARLPSPRSILRIESALSRRRERGCSTFQTLQEGDEIEDLVRLELELRHGGMAGHDAFGQSLLQRLDGII